MTLLQFRRLAEPHNWQRGEMSALIAACGESLKKGTVTGWEVGETEHGDPQLYLIGSAPDHECVLCVSRVGRTYVVEDGAGHIVCEHDAIGSLTDQVRYALRHKKAAIVARATAAWFAIKGSIEERLEPMLAEPIEILEHFAPQLVAMI